MIRTLLIVAGASLVLCVAAFAGAAALGGSDFRERGWTWTIREDASGDGSIRMEHASRADEPEVTRDLAWTGGDSLEVDVPGQVVFTQGPDVKMTVTGPKALVEAVRLVGDRLTLADDGERTERVHLRWRRDGVDGWSDSDRLRVTVTAPSVTRFVLNGSGDLDIRDYDQSAIDVTVNGSGEVNARGRAQTARVALRGSGDADLADVETRDAQVDVAGSGTVRVGPEGRAEIDLAGSGDVDLTRRPTTLVQTVTGSGEINQRD